MHVLISDDCIVKQALIKEILKELGHTYEVVNNGNEAIKKLEINYYDIVLMDTNMPEMDGIEATSIIRNIHSKVINHKIPIINISSQSKQHYLDYSLKVGMNDYLGESISTESLKNAIAKVILL
jgi:CheY-like chemotaxis protein